MEYGTLIRQAWTITWRYRFLWLLGILAGGAVGVPSMGGGGGGGSGATGNRGPDEIRQLDPAVGAASQQAVTWATEHAALLIGAAALVTLLALALLVLSFVAQGAMARATADLATGTASSLGRAWAAGVHLFWRYVGLWAALVVAAMVVAAVVGAVIAAAVGATIVGQSPAAGIALAGVAVAAVVVGFVAATLRLTPANGVPRWLVALGAALFALPVVTIVIAAGLLLSIVVAFAQRAIAVEDIGPLAALRSGWRLARAHLGESLLAWLVNVGLALAAGIAFLVGVLGALLLLGGLGAAVLAVAGFSAPALAYVGVGGLVLLVGVLTAAGIANTFFWTYWTLAYLRLSGRPTSSAA